jgi:hypothetical protein
MREFDLPKLADVLSELDDMALTGFSPAELEELLTWTPMEETEEEHPLGGESYAW